MASDISLAVGDGARRMTYAELATVRGISLSSARRLVLRHRWPRQTGNDGVIRVTVPLTALRKSPETADFRDTTTPGSVTTTDPVPPDSVSHVTDAMTVERVSTTDAAAAAAVTTTDPLTVIVIQTLSQAVDMLREDLGIANSLRLAERERAERRVNELQALLTEEQRQAQTSAPDIRGIIKEVIREIAGAAPPDNRDDDRERLQTLETTIAALQEQVEYAESGLVAERQRAEQAEHRVDELQVALADARTAAMITGYEAAALRTQLALLTERRPWWRRWFR
jgi:hypothetical protein